MRLRAYLKLLLITMFAGGLAGAAWWVDHSVSMHRAEEVSLRWARQIGAQAESLMTTARERHELDPLRWAVTVLSQGTENRAYRISRVQAVENGTEKSSFDPQTGTLEWTRVMIAESGAAVRVQIPGEYLGFLGARGKLQNDLQLIALFMLCWMGLWAMASMLGPSVSAPGVSATKSDPALKDKVLTFVREAKALLTQLGLNIREMLKQAQHLAKSASKSREVVGNLRQRIHSGIEEMRDARSALKEAEQAITQAEVNALNLVIEAARLGDTGRHLSTMVEDFHRTIRKVRTLTQKGEGAVGRLELQIEPWATDADEAYHSYDAVFEATQNMDEHIRKTTESLIGQAKLIQSMNTGLNPIGPVAQT